MRFSDTWPWHQVDCKAAIMSCQHYMMTSLHGGDFRIIGLCEENPLVTCHPFSVTETHVPILAQLMACCLMTPSHYLNQWWLIISEVQWQSSEDSFTRDTSAINYYIILEIIYLRFYSNLPAESEDKGHLNPHSVPVMFPFIVQPSVEPLRNCLS